MWIGNISSATYRSSAGWQEIVSVRKQAECKVRLLSAMYIKMYPRRISYPYPLWCIIKLHKGNIKVDAVPLNIFRNEDLMTRWPLSSTSTVRSMQVQLDRAVLGVVK
ncbi:Energy-coupling factor transporter ATP-binding protein EcfA2 [Frankliniella fusca]|uniref:Energy-coupling factor transporter ATP-binding protein EcfA2 n=1 Tax=Frankliniella fusca TaxID=407009 RepID=A0AAE1GUQ8_9NEOP|nr:Energy-coupling factor transporter ATP-binding protein EcfA2 [Frankliniella fusca]KAK3922919.1 Energy-coupling factor transporter ATP-binding protein EcfA2 [Frankliniella fusca]